MKVEPKEEHRWLQRLVGRWTYEFEAAEPGKEAEKQTGTETVRALGDLWIVSEWGGEMPGAGTVSSVMTLGFDSSRGRFVGTFVTSMMEYLWVYDGWLEGDTLVLEAEGPGMSEDGGMARYRDSIEMRGDDHRVFSSRMLGADGEWRQFMTSHHHRVR